MGIAVILITHQQNLISVSDKALVLLEGRMEICGTKDNVFDYLKNKSTSVKRDRNEQQTNGT